MNRREQLYRELAVMEREHPTTRVRVPADVLPFIARYRKWNVEVFLVLTLNGAHEVLRVREVSRGIVNRTLVHPREVYRGAIRDNAVSIVAAHNHPSGSVEPSGEDREVTRRLAAAGETVGIRLLDHVIVSTQGYYSFLEQGEL